MIFLLIDVGSTNIKCAFFDGTSRKILKTSNVAFPPAELYGNGLYEVSINEIKKAVFSFGSDADALLLSVQMHGYVLKKNGIPVTGYVSWRDRRAEKIYRDFSLPKEYGTAVKANLPKISVAYTSEYILKNTDSFDEFCSLGSYLAEELTGKNASHATDLAASGFYCGTIADNVNFKLPGCYDTIVPVGKTDGGMTVYTPVGDHQATVYGCDYENSYVLNLGTAAQICCVENGRIYGDFESRPFFGKKTLCTVTGLSGGGAISGKSDDELFEKLCLEYGEAIKKLPEKNKIIVAGGLIKYRKELLVKVLSRLCVPYEFSNGEETMTGLIRLAGEINNG